MTELTIQQRDFLIKVRDTFIPLYAYVPDMEDGSNWTDTWTRENILEWIGVILDNDKYYDNDASWLSDLRLFYIKENK
jgi:hypothetical protein